MVRYPQIRVACRSTNPLALVAAVRQALRRAGLPSDEVRRFSAEAFASAEPSSIRDVCRRWVRCSDGSAPD